MVKLVNLKRKNNIIECDLIPEDSLEFGHVIVDLGTEEVKGFTLPKGYEWCRNHINHARNKLIKLAGDKNLPEEYLVMWY